VRRFTAVTLATNPYAVNCGKTRNWDIGFEIDRPFLGAGISRIDQTLRRVPVYCR